MAGGTSRQPLGRDTFFSVLSSDLVWVVFVAGITGVLIVAGRVTGLAGGFLIPAVIQRKGVKV